MNSEYYIVCDHEQLKQNIIEKCKCEEKVFIKSMTKQVEHISVEVADNGWKKAADAHLTTFCHAQENNIKSFWNIDADDTSFCLPPEKVATALFLAEKYAKENSIEIFSLDMYVTAHQGNDWSFGVTYICAENRDWMQTFASHCKEQQYKSFPKIEENVDWYVGYLRNTYTLPVETFYIKNVNFIHWGMGGYGPLLYRFRDGFLDIPRYVEYQLSSTMKNFVGKKKIWYEIIAIDAGIQVADNKERSKRRYLRNISKSYGVPCRYLLKNVKFKGLVLMTINKIKKGLRMLNVAKKGENDA
jgi:hypothetical protein